MSDQDKRLGVYFHIPFCASKCAYCDFCSLPGRDKLMPYYQDALLIQLQETMPRMTDYFIDTVYFGGGLEQTRIKAGTNIPATYLAYAERFGYSSTSVPLTIGWSRDDRDSALAPNSGVYQRLNSEWSVAGDSRYVRANYQYQQYIPLNKRFTVAFNGEVGIGKGLNGRPFPVFKNFYSGGLGSVRGFDQGTLGPRDVTGASLGGPKKLTLNAELIAPFPGAGNDRTLSL